MTASIFNNKVMNPVPAARTGGTIPTGNEIISVAKWVDALEPRKTEILDRIKKSGFTVESLKYQWGQSYRLPFSSTTTAVLDATETAITLVANEGKFFQYAAVLEIIDYKTNGQLDMTTREEVWVATMADTAPVVVRGNMSGTGVAHAAGAYVGQIGTALPYATEFKLTPVYRGDQLFNYPQRFYAEVAADKAAQHTPTWEHKSNILYSDFEDAASYQRWLLEQTVVLGTRFEGDGNGQFAATTQKPYKMGGIDYFITNHSGRVVNLNGGKLTTSSFESILREMYKEIEDGGSKTLLMSADAAAALDTIITPFRIADEKTTSMTLFTEKLKFRWGTLEIMPTQHLKGDVIYFVDFDKMAVVPYAGCDWSTQEMPVNAPVDMRAFWGDFCFLMEAPHSMAKLYNFTTDLRLYPGQNFGQ